MKSPGKPGVRPARSTPFDFGELSSSLSLRAEGSRAASSRLVKSPIDDVLVLGDHPCAYLAAAILRTKPALRIHHAPLPDENPPDRLVLINPALFDLHPLLHPLRKTLPVTPMHGARFISADPKTAGEHRCKSPLALIARYADLHAAIVAIAVERDVHLHALEFSRAIKISHIDEHHIEIDLNSQKLSVRAILLAGDLPPEQSRLLGLTQTWDREFLYRRCWFQMESPPTPPAGPRLLPMSLDLLDAGAWAWLLAHDRAGNLIGQISILQQMSGATQSPADLCHHWIDLLSQIGYLPARDGPIPPDDIHTASIPLAGALGQDIMANRTLVFGPAGGFFSSCGEDIYPNCWSAVHAAEAMRKSLSEKHLQDGLNTHGQQWRTDLGDYLRGPRQNLRFLLPLVYRNPVMATRMAEAIYLGKKIVR